MNFRTSVEIGSPDFKIEPMEQILFIGSCFADSIGRRFLEERFPAVVNPFGVMYNPVSVLHTVERTDVIPSVVFLTLGTNHVYRLKETAEIVDNCQKRPHQLFQEEELSVEQCADCLKQIVDTLSQRNPAVHIVLTVSPIRYAKYGYHESQLSKATLLLAVHQLVQAPLTSQFSPLTSQFSPLTSQLSPLTSVTYFPAYEIVLDELRDYRFYQPDMLHPSSQAVEYIWERLVEVYFSPRAKQYLQEWKPIKEALAHRPFNPDSAEYQQFLARVRQQERDFLAHYGGQLPQKQ